MLIEIGDVLPGKVIEVVVPVLSVPMNVSWIRLPDEGRPTSGESTWMPSPLLPEIKSRPLTVIAESELSAGGAMVRTAPRPIVLFEPLSISNPIALDEPETAPDAAYRPSQSAAIVFPLDWTSIPPPRR